MKKHLFLLGWEREDRVVKRRFEMYIACGWPSPPDATWKDVEAMAVMADGEGLPTLVEQMCYAVFPMTLRARYAGDGVTGPYVVDDPEDLTQEQLLERLEAMDNEEVKRLLYRG